MTNPTQSNGVKTLASGKPVKEAINDEFGYYPFATHLAKTISAMTEPEGTVFAIYGPWGSGKTTLLNFIRSELNVKDVILIDFNAWSFSSSHDLVRKFFGQIVSSFPSNKAWNQISTAFSDLTDLVAEAGEGTNLGTAAAVVSKSKGLNKKDLHELKKEIAQLLTEKKKRVVVFVDDIDRLDSRAIQDLFSVIKSVADFPNIVYVLAFDFEVVSEVLGKLEGIKGQDYLEKIVQVSFKLPVPDRRQIGRALISRLQNIWGPELSEKVLNSEDFWHMFLNGMLPLMSTPRQVNRFAVSLNITFAAVRDEVDSIDFCGLEVLRLCAPGVFEIVRQNPSAFAGPSLMRVAKDREFHQRWMKAQNLSTEDPVFVLTSFLFPKFKADLDNLKYSENERASFPRIQSLRAFPSYFKLSVAEGAVSSVEMKSLLALSGDSKAFLDALLELSKTKKADGYSRVLSFFENWNDYDDQVTPNNAHAFLRALFSLSDKVWECEDERARLESKLLHADQSFVTAKFEFMGFHSTGPAYVVWKVLSKLEPTKRFQPLKFAIEKSEAFYVVVNAANFFHLQVLAAAKKSETYEFMTPVEVDQIIALALAKIRNKASKNKLLETPDLGGTIRFWSQRDHVECAEWFAKTAKDPNSLPILLAVYLDTSRSLGDGYPKETPFIDFPAIDSFVPLEEIQEVASQALKTDNESGRKKQALQLLASLNLNIYRAKPPKGI